jgi:hypothetical protein
MEDGTKTDNVWTSHVHIDVFVHVSVSGSASVQAYMHIRTRTMCARDHVMHQRSMAGMVLQRSMHASAWVGRCQCAQYMLLKLFVGRVAARGPSSGSLHSSHPHCPRHGESAQFSAIHDLRSECRVTVRGCYQH